MTITLTREAEQEAAQRNLTPEQMAAQAMLAGLRGQQTLAELAQHPLPVGRRCLISSRSSARGHPPTETDEEVAALKVLRQICFDPLSIS